MRGIIIVCIICFCSSTLAQNQEVVTHKISVEYKDRKRTNGEILLLGEHFIEFKIKPKKKHDDSVKVIRLDSNDAHFIRSITVARKKAKESTVFLSIISWTALGILIGNSTEYGSDGGVALAVPGLLIGTIFGVSAGFESKKFYVKGDVADFEKALLGISERLAKANRKSTRKSKKPGA